MMASCPSRRCLLAVGQSTRLAAAVFVALAACAAFSFELVQSVEGLPLPFIPDLVWTHVGNRSVTTTQNGATVTISVPIYTGTLEFGVVTGTWNNTFTPDTTGQWPGSSLGPYTTASTDFITRGFGGSVPGPMLRMDRCAQYSLTVVNTLGADQEWQNKLVMHHTHPNSTNLHVHGLHVSPLAPADDITLVIEPGTSYTYNYTIPCDHAGGLHWYHTHRHGVVALQSGGGALGPILINDAPEDGVPAGLTAMGDTLLVLHRVQTGILIDAAFNTMDNLFNVSSNDPRHNADLDFYLVNGQPLPTIQMVEGVYTRFHILHVSAQDNSIITWSAANPTDGTKCDWQLLAKDGVYLPTAPRQVGGLSMTTSSRSDVMLACSWSNTGLASVTVNLQSDGRTIAYLNVALPTGRNQTSNSYTPLSFGSFSVCRPWYLRDLISPSPFEPVHGHAQLYLANVSLGGYSYEYLNQIAFKMRVNTIQSWQLQNSDHHPFHLHAFHVQLSGTNIVNNASTSNYHLPGDWLDTVSQPNNITVLFRAWRWLGYPPAHCHILPHEDMGSMITNQVFDDPEPQSATLAMDNPTTMNPQCYNSGVLIPGITLPAPTSCHCDKKNCTAVGDCCDTCPAQPGPICPSTVFNWNVINQHYWPTDMWIVVNGQVFNVTDYLYIHPGGLRPWYAYAGHDATFYFYSQQVHIGNNISLINFVPCLGYANGPEPNGYDPMLTPARASCMTSGNFSIQGNTTFVDPNCLAVKLPLMNPGVPRPQPHGSTAAADTDSTNGSGMQYPFPCDNTVPGAVCADYVIIGVGSSACALASELTKDPDVTVLMIEEGDWAEYPKTNTPDMWVASKWYATLTNPQISRPYHTTNQAGFANRPSYAYRGRVVGGCSSHNAQVFIHPNHNDLIEWGAEVPAWNWTYLQPYASVLHAAYGFATKMDDVGHYSQIDTMMTICKEQGSGVENAHPNPLSQKGCNWRRHMVERQYNADGTWWLKRKTAFSAFIEPILPFRPNLKILTNTRVTRIIFNGTDATGVMVQGVTSGDSYNITANIETILAAGVFNTPQLLKISGIGPRAELERFGVEVISELNGVGANLRDDGFCNVYGAPLAPEYQPPVTSAASACNPQTENVPGWRQESSGYKFYPTQGVQHWLPDDHDETVPPEYMVAYDVQPRFPFPANFPNPYYTYVSIEPLAMKSRGTVNISSLNVDDMPIIDTHYNELAADRQTWMDAVAFALDGLNNPHFLNLTNNDTSWAYPQRSDVLNSTGGIDPTKLWTWISQNCAGTNGHPQGSCRMGPAPSSTVGGITYDNVVDGCMHVFGVTRLRVIDASIFPNPVHGNTNQPAVLLGLRAATLIQMGDDQCYAFPNTRSWDDTVAGVYTQTFIVTPNNDDNGSSFNSKTFGAGIGAGLGIAVVVGLVGFVIFHFALSPARRSGDRHVGDQVELSGAPSSPSPLIQQPSSSQPRAIQVSGERSPGPEGVTDTGSSVRFHIAPPQQQEI